MTTLLALVAIAVYSNYMLYVYFGEDKDSARAKVQATIAKMLSKSPEALYFRITSDTLQEYSFEELTNSQSLFKSEYIVLLDTLFEDKEGERQVLNALPQIAAAPHPFFILDATLLASVKKKVEKYATAVHEFTLTEKKETHSFNTFALTDAFGEKNIKKIWSLFRQAKYAGVSDEEIHGILFWMSKSLLLARESKTAEEAGMKPYPFNKARGFLKNFSNTQELDAIVHSIAILPQRARREAVPLEIMLELFILNLSRH